jgi:capsid protein
MKVKKRVVGGCLALLTALPPLFTAATPAYPADLIIDYADPGPCADDRFLNMIVKRFRYQVTHVPNLPNVDILQFYRIYEQRYLPEQKRWPIGRRYCGATVALSDGQERPVWYLIEEGMGFASIGDKVEFCVSGFDRWYVYDGHCRVLREPPPPLPSQL